MKILMTTKIFNTVTKKLHKPSVQYVYGSFRISLSNQYIQLVQYSLDKKVSNKFKFV